jgi:hypothetical protein
VCDVGLETCSYFIDPLKVEVGATLNNIKGVILDVMNRYGGFTNSDMASKWICLGCDDDSIFQDIQSWVIT